MLRGDDQLFNCPSNVSISGAPLSVDGKPNSPPQSTFTAEAEMHWLDDSLAVSAYFTVAQYPSELWRISTFPQLSTRDLVNSVIDKVGLRRAIALHVGANLVTFCVPAVAKILHSLGHQCLCRSSVENTTTNVEDWLRQKVDLAVPECQWHAGSTPYARVNYLMALVQEVFRTLPISWSEAVTQSEDGNAVDGSLECIAQAVRSAKLEPQVMLGTWAAENMFPITKPMNTPERWEQQPPKRFDERNSLPRTGGQEDGNDGFSSQDSQHAGREGLSALRMSIHWRLIAVLAAYEAGEDDAISVGSTVGDLDKIPDRRKVIASQLLSGMLLGDIDKGWKLTSTDASSVDASCKPNVRSSRAPAPEYDMTRHPVDGSLGDKNVNSRKRRRSYRSG